MNKMKSKIIILIISFLPFISCNDWLEEDPVSGQNLDGMATDLKGLEILAIGAYSSLQDCYELNNNLGVVGTDECMSIEIKHLRVKPLDQYIFTPSNLIFRGAWDVHYKVIQDANIVINRAFEIEMSDAARAKIVGEMRFLRAFAYFRLVQWFGELPLVIDEVTEFDKSAVKYDRVPIPMIYELIISDLQFASTQGVLSQKVSDGRVSGNAAKVLLGKVYLTMGTAKDRSERLNVVEGYKSLPLSSTDYYRLSYQLLGDIIKSGDYSLEAIYGDLFLPDYKNSTDEIIWQVQYSSAVTNLGSAWSKQFGMVGSGGQLHTFNAMIGRHYYQPVPSLWGYYNRGDRRMAWNLKDFKVNIEGNVKEGAVTKGNHRMNVSTWAPSVLNAHFDSNSNLTAQISCAKYRWGVGKDPEQYYLQNSMSYPANNCPHNVCVLRYADVMLMFAEADLLLNGGVATQTSVDLVNTLLKRAREGKTEAEMLNYPMNNQGEYVSGTISATEKPYYLYDYTTATLTYDELKKERARELCFEFHRWNDLVRWGDLESAVAGRRHATSADGVNLERSVVDPSKHYLFPIPQWEIDIAKLKQNPNYTASDGDI